MEHRPCTTALGRSHVPTARHPDDYNREVLAIEVDTSLPAQRVIRALEQIKEHRPLPTAIRGQWTGVHQRQPASLVQAPKDHPTFIQPGKPTKRLHRTAQRNLRRDVLGATLRTLDEVRLRTTEWMYDYNHLRPRSTRLPAASAHPT
ncbi:MAG: transposase [Flavobacteriales bacterium]|nr:transposase [Flavobacteriales bacterium]